MIYQRVQVTGFQESMVHLAHFRNKRTISSLQTSSFRDLRMRHEYYYSSQSILLDIGVTPGSYPPSPPRCIILLSLPRPNYYIWHTICQDTMFSETIDPYLLNPGPAPVVFRWFKLSVSLKCGGAISQMHQPRVYHSPLA